MKPASALRRALRLAPLCLAAAAAAAPDAPALRHDPFALPAALRAAAAPPAGAGAQAAAAAPALPPWQPRLSAVIVGPRSAMVLVDGVVVELGQEVAGRKLVRVDEHRAVFAAKDGTTVEIGTDGAGRAAAKP